MSSSLPVIDTNETAASADQRHRFHLSLNVASLDKSVAFFRTFLGVEPAKHRSDYAKFELDEPPLVLSLEPCAPTGRGALNHVGIRMPGPQQLVEMQRRLETHGMPTQREEGVECCYARQTKFWLRDPDQNLWEIYTLEEDIEQRGVGQVPEDLPPNTATDAPPVAVSTSDSMVPAASIWTHRMGQTLLAKLPMAERTVDEVNLQGTLNEERSDLANEQLLAEVARILRPGGKLKLHVLTADEPISPERISLPGAASRVRVVPVLRKLVEGLEQGGFANILITKLNESPCFTIDGCEMRETMLEAVRANHIPQPSPGSDEVTPCSAAAASGYRILYKGPWRAVSDDQGHSYRRGDFVPVEQQTWETLRSSGTPESFLFTFGKKSGSCQA